MIYLHYRKKHCSVLYFSIFQSSRLPNRSKEIEISFSLYAQSTRYCEMIMKNELITE
jgi:hypothetical protein